MEEGHRNEDSGALRVFEAVVGGYLSRNSTTSARIETVALV